jgi:hypothetical protein
MSKLTNQELAERINVTLDVLKESARIEDVVASLMRRYRISRRQTYRYIQEARKTNRKLPIPEAKQVFTVKLPISLVARLRQMAGCTGESLSSLMTRALEAFLKRARHG